ncbi:MAG: hypothetical protein KAH23_01360, partial [Kiritimatiellae bacterium]|nr:hypothetical protein [Kiritimatiellia bacterium]
MKNRFLAALVIIAAVFVMCHGACGDDANTTSSWLNKTKAEGIRSTWIYTHNVPDLTNHIAFLKEQGINLICLGPRILNDVELLPQEENKPYYAGIQDKRVEIIRTVVREAKKHDIAVLVMFRTYAEAYLRILKDRKYRRVVDINGDAGMWLACPADLSFFKGIEFSRAKTVASILAEEKAVGGILYETEAYCARTFYPGYGSQKTKFCYCDLCFEKFMKLNDSSGELPDPKSRYEWLCKKGLDGKYQEYMVDVYANSYRTMFTEVRKIYPETIAGLYPTSVEPHSAGFAKGTSTDTLP